MKFISLSYQDLALAAVLVLLLAGFAQHLALGVARSILIAAVRTAIQLTLLGLVLKALFANVHLVWVVGMALLMLLAAGREVMARQKHAYTGIWGFGIGSISMFISSFAVTVLALTVVVGPSPWYTPQYAIPLLGMLLGNTMNGIALGLDRLKESAWTQRNVIEARLCMGEEAHWAIADIRRESMRVGLIPMINAMSAAGIISLPGMMTGQILAGSPPVEAVKYQILIMFLITAGTGFGTMAAVWLGSRRLFDDRDRLRLDRLRGPAAPRPRLAAWLNRLFTRQHA
jgi:putative ABC transport system permease protein